MGKSCFRGKRSKERINVKIGQDTDESTQIGFYRNLFIESIQTKLKYLWSILLYKEFQEKDEKWVEALSDDEHCKSREKIGQNSRMVYRCAAKIFNKWSGRNLCMYKICFWKIKFTEFI